MQKWCFDVLSMFVLSKWQCVALQMRWRVSVRTLFYSYHTFLDHTTNISRKVCKPRRVSVSEAPNNVQNCHLDKTNMDKTSQHHTGYIICCCQAFYSDAGNICRNQNCSKGVVFLKNRCWKYNLKYIMVSFCKLQLFNSSRYFVKV